MVPSPLFLTLFASSPRYFRFSTAWQRAELALVYFLLDDGVWRARGDTHFCQWRDGAEMVLGETLRSSVVYLPVVEACVCAVAAENVIVMHAYPDVTIQLFVL